MTRPRAATKAPPSAPKKRLPAALVANAKRAATLAKGRKAGRIQALLASITDRKRTLAGAFWDLGRDLRELKDLRAEAALGHATFYALCREECGLSEAFVTGAMRVAGELTRAAAIELGSQRRAVAFLDLARATPEDDTPSELLAQGLTRGKVRLAKGASARKVEQAAKAVREELRAKAPVNTAKKRVGNTTTVDERARAATLEKGLARAGFTVEVRAVATRPGQPCTFALRHLPEAAFAALGKLLAKG